MWTAITHMTPQEIRAAIAASPELQALGHDTTALTAALSVGRTVADTTTKFASLGIAERYPDLNGLPGPLAAELCLQKLEAFAVTAMQSTDPATKLLGGAVQRQMGHLAGGGMALGSPAIGRMLDVIVAADGLTRAEADALVGIADVADPVSEMDVRRACYADNGDWRA